jgi:hypothetical protein
MQFLHFLRLDTLLLNGTKGCIHKVEQPFFLARAQTRRATRTEAP